MTKKAEQDQARELRRRGKSMKAIARELEVSLGSVHLWTRDIEMSAEDVARLAHRGHHGNILKAQAARLNQQLARVIAHRAEAETEWPTLRTNPAFTFGLAIYIGEGHKTSSSVGVTNSDPAVIRTALRFFDLIGVDMSRVKISITLHQGENPDAALRYWSAELGLSPGYFHKVFPSKVSGGKRARHLIHGTAHARLGDYRIKRKLNRWMELAKQEFGTLQEEACPAPVPFRSSKTGRQ